jgi:hypothetical protein
LATVIRYLYDRLDQVLLMRLPKRQPVQPPKTAQFVEFNCLTRLWRHDEHAIDFLTGARPPRASTGRIGTEFLIGMVTQHQPRA